MRSVHTITFDFEISMKGIKKNGPILYLMLGAPGSGKSYFAARICKEYKFVHLRSDAIRKQIFAHPTYSKKENERLFGLIDFLAGELLSRGVSVVYDANCITRKIRSGLRRIAAKHMAACVVLWVQAPLDIAIRRAGTRSYHPVNARVVVGLDKKIEKPNRERVIIIDGTKTYNEQKGLLKLKNGKNYS